MNILLFAIFQLILPHGDSTHPSAIVPAAPTLAPMRIWYDEVAFHVDGRAWVWDELGAQPKDGAQFKVNLGKLNPLLPEEDIILEASLDNTASRVEMGSFGPIAEAPIENEVHVTAGRAGTVSSRFMADCATPEYVEVRGQKPLRAGETATFRIKDRGPTSGWTYETVRDVNGRVIYKADGPYRIPGLKFDFDLRWTEPEKQLLHLKVRIWNREAGAHLRVCAKDLKSGTITAWRKEVDLPCAWGAQDVAVSVGDMPPGFYTLVLEFVAPDGSVNCVRKTDYFKPDGKAPWEGTTLGAEDTVPPPWTRPEFGADGRFTCWNRVHKLGGSGLVESIVSGGKELLAKPVALVMNGQALDFTVEKVEAKVASAVYHLVSKAGVRADVTCEFDGFMYFRVTTPAAVDSLACRVVAPVGTVYAFDDCSSDTAKDVLRKGEKFARFVNPTKMPWWWLIGRSGLLGGFDNLHGTRIRDYEHAVKVVSDGSEVTVETKLVDTPCTTAGERTVEFYLEATPVKPKNMVFASLPQEKVRRWTGYMCESYETKYPGFENPVAFARFRKELDDGVRVFYYNGTKGMSPNSPLWGWYGDDWNQNTIEYYAHEVPLHGKYVKLNNWAYGCPNSRNFLEYKVWGVNWMLNGPEPKMKDLYFDLAEPGICRNPKHRCMWTDDFGVPMRDTSHNAVREIHQRCYRLVKAKNADGEIYGHFNKMRTPSDAYFAFCTVGESLCDAMYRNGHNYYDVLTPEMMQTLVVPKTQEMAVFFSTQFQRSLHCYVGAGEADRYIREKRWNEPEELRAMRHIVAYLKIHDAICGYANKTNDRDGPIKYLIEEPIRALGPSRRYCAYFHDKPTIQVSPPSSRFLWADYENENERILVLLNDTDEKISERIELLSGLRGVGKEMLEGTAFDFSTGSATLSFGPRQAYFIRIARCGR